MSESGKVTGAAIATTAALIFGALALRTEPDGIDRESVV